MPAKWIREPGPIHIPLLMRHYSYAADPHSGFAFDVDEKNHAVILDNDDARENYAKAQAGLRDGSVIDHEVQDYGRNHWDAGAIRCGCGRVLEMTGDWEGTRCECGREYNTSGQQLRANWRVFCRETGELNDEDML